MERQAFQMRPLRAGWNAGRSAGARDGARDGRGRSADGATRRAAPLLRRPGLGRRGRHGRNRSRCRCECRLAGRGPTCARPPIAERHDDRDRHEHERRRVRHDHRPVRDRQAVRQPDDEAARRASTCRAARSRCWTASGASGGSGGTARAPSGRPRSSRRRRGCRPSAARSRGFARGCPGRRLAGPLARLVLRERLGRVDVAERREVRDHRVPAGRLDPVPLPEQRDDRARPSSRRCRAARSAACRGPSRRPRRSRSVDASSA